MQVDIKTITVDGKKLSRSVFSQLETGYAWSEKPSFDRPGKPASGVALLGYVLVGKERWYLFSRGGLLYREKVEMFAAPKSVDQLFI